MLPKPTLALALTATVTVLLCAATAAPAWAKPSRTATSSTSAVGIDVSYPQCSDTLPAGEAFAVVGVNGGLANDYSPCLGAQFAYAEGLTPGTTQPTAQTYLNTADPGNTVADWPSPGQLGAYGTTHGGTTATPSGTTCNYADPTSAAGQGANSPGCAYIYGYDMVAGMPSAGVTGDLSAFSTATNGGALYAQPVWLDVETANSWQTGTTGLAMNIAALQGMVDALTDAASAATSPAPAVGIYSTGSQWNQITGTPADTAGGNLSRLPVWLPGARSEKAAVANCSPSSFTGGPVSITQWFAHPYDADHSCAD